jgi:hypothetical protein
MTLRAHNVPALIVQWSGILPSKQVTRDRIPVSACMHRDVPSSNLRLSLPPRFLNCPLIFNAKESRLRVHSVDGLAFSLGARGSYKHTCPINVYAETHIEPFCDRYAHRECHLCCIFHFHVAINQYFYWCRLPWLFV